MSPIFIEFDQVNEVNEDKKKVAVNLSHIVSLRSETYKKEDQCRMFFTDGHSIVIDMSLPEVANIINNVDTPSFS